jgi:hypothetical protein
VPQDEQLDVLRVQATATPNQGAKQSPEREIQEGEDHAADPPSPRREETRHEYWRPSGRSRVSERASISQRTIPDRRVSLVDPDARPIRIGSPIRPTEFGYKARIADTAEGFVIADIPERGGPTDGSLLDGAIAKAKRSGMELRSVYGDRGFGTSTGDAVLAKHKIVTRSYRGSSGPRRVSTAATGDAATAIATDSKEGSRN